MGGSPGRLPPAVRSPLKPSDRIASSECASVAFGSLLTRKNSAQSMFTQLPLGKVLRSACNVFVVIFSVFTFFCNGYNFS